MIAQRCRAPLSAHNVMNLCCPTIFAPTVAATGERQSSKKKKNRMITSLNPRKPVHGKDVWPAWARLDVRIVLFLKKGHASWMGALQEWGSSA
jgi:hypothetical protein